MAIEQPWAPEKVAMLDGEQYADAGGTYRWQQMAEAFDTEPQDIHSGDEPDDLDTIAGLGITVKR